jgi:hypothetical protein
MEHIRKEEQVWSTSGRRYGAHQEGEAGMEHIRKENQVWTHKG